MKNGRGGYTLIWKEVFFIERGVYIVLIVISSNLVNLEAVYVSVYSFYSIFLALTLILMHVRNVCVFFICLFGCYDCQTQL